MTITVDIQNYDDVVRGMKRCKKDLAKGARRTMLDVAKRESKTVARNEVTKVYNIKKSDVSEKYKGYKETGSISLEGIVIPFFRVEFESHRTFTPTHFQMTPKARPAGRRRYTVKWKPLKAGSKGDLRSESGFPVFLAAANGPTLPWARLQAKSWHKGTQGWKHTPIEVIRTHLAVPQMIDNEKVQPHIEAEISRRVEAGLRRYIK